VTTAGTGDLYQWTANKLGPTFLTFTKSAFLRGDSTEKQAEKSAINWIGLDDDDDND
jgi:hypothetical protein